MTNSLENEIWKDIKGYEGIYQVSNLGRIKSLNYRRTGKENLISINNNGKEYKYCTLYKTKKKNHYIHRLVAEAFIDNPNNLPEVNHKKSEELSNNCVDNLEWCTRKYNCNYGEHNKKLSKSLKGKQPWNKGKIGVYSEETKKLMSDKTKERLNNRNNNPLCKPVICLSTSQLFNSVVEASEQLNCDRGFISQICKGERNNTKGYKFMYYNDYMDMSMQHSNCI